MNKKYQSFAEFYPYYLSEHQHPICRRLHVVGISIVIILAIVIAMTANWPLLFLIPVIGYGFAWIGHFVFEKNRPATFTYPVYSFMGDWVMFKDIIMGKIPL